MVRHVGAKRASEAVSTVAEAKMFEAKVKLSMGGTTAPREGHTVGEVVAGYIADGAGRLSPGSIDFYRKGRATLPETSRGRAVSEVTPLGFTACTPSCGPSGRVTRWSRSWSLVSGWRTSQRCRGCR